MARASGKAIRFTHINLENWRNFSQVKVDLQGRVFLVGPNASGKSNFLDVFRFLHDIVAVGGGFQESVRKRGGVSRLRCLANGKGILGWYTPTHGLALGGLDGSGPLLLEEPELSLHPEVVRFIPQNVRPYPTPLWSANLNQHPLT